MPIRLKQIGPQARVALKQIKTRCGEVLTIHADKYGNRLNFNGNCHIYDTFAGHYDVVFLNK